jgi:four helix bundle protein
MSNIANNKKKYDLEDRTANFGREIIKFAQKIPKNCVTIPLITQLIRAGTSVGANYLEADDAESGKDFVHKMAICRKESRETKHWLKMVVVAVPPLEREAKILWKEAQELNLIFASIIRKKKK